MMKNIVPFALLTAVLIVATSIGLAHPPNQPQIEDVLSRYFGSVPFSPDQHDETDAEGAGGQQAIVVHVDCNAGDLIGRALLTPADELIVNISGICEENVEIRRDNVTLVGSDPTLDGIQGDGEADVVTVREAVNVTIENLKIPSPLARVFVDGSSSDVRIVHCDLGDTRVEVTQSSHVEMEDVSASYLLAELGGRVYCRGCNLFGVSVTDGGNVALMGSIVDDPSPFNFGVVVGALRGTVVAYSTQLNGWVDARGSTLALIDSSVGFGVTLTANSHAELLGQVDVFEEPMIVAAFSSVWIEPGSSFLGEIDCVQGGNAACADVMIDGTVQGCTFCNPSEGKVP